MSRDHGRLRGRLRCTPTGLGTQRHRDGLEEEEHPAVTAGFDRPEAKPSQIRVTHEDRWLHRAVKRAVVALGPLRAAKCLAVSLALVGCAEPAASGPQVISYREMYEVNRIVEIEDGYAIAGAHGVFAYEHNDALRWETEWRENPVAMTRFGDDALMVATRSGARDDMDIQLHRVDPDGAINGTTVVAAPGRPSSVELVSTGKAWVFGCDYPQCWFGTVSAAGEVALESSPNIERVALAFEGDGAFVAQTTWTTPTWDDNEIDLVRLAEDGSVRWQTRVSTSAEDGGASSYHLVRGPHDDVMLVGAHPLLGAGERTLRRFDADGRLVEQRRRPLRGEYEAPFVSPDGGILWLAVTDPTEMHIELVDADGKTIEETVIPGDGTPVMDATFIGDVLYVLTHDGLTRVAVPRTPG